MGEEPNNSSTLVIAALAVFGLFMAGVPLVGVAGIALLTDIQASASDCTPTATVVSDKGPGDEVINVPNGWAPLVEEAARTAGLPVSVVAAQLQQESQWNEKAVGPVLEDGTLPKGLGQFTDVTWTIYGNGGDPLKAADAIPAYGRYMAVLKKEVEPLADGNADELVRLALAAYNAGPGRIDEFQGIPPFPETVEYIETILGTGQTQFSAGCTAPAGARAWGGDLGDGEWTTPLPGGKFTSGYGNRSVPGLPAWAQHHVGVDLATPGAGYRPGGVVVAPTDLRITGFLPADGCVMAKENGDDPDFGFAFCHLDSHQVKQDQKLKRGNVIGVEGNVAGSVGTPVMTHLHLEIYDPGSPEMNYPENGHNLDPEPILKEKGAWAA